MAFFPPTDSPRVSHATVLILGEPKLGKTLLAATWPRPYFLDVDDGAGHTKAPRMTFPKSPAGFKLLEGEVKRLANLKPGDDGLLDHTVEGTSFKVGTVVLDSVTEAQLLAGLGIKTGSDTRRYYGDLRKAMLGMMTTFRAIHAHLILVCHAKARMDEESKLTFVGIDLEGSIRDTLPKWVDLAMHVVADPMQPARRTIITQPTRKSNTVYFAGDRYHLFEGKEYDLWAGDQINAAMAQHVLQICMGGLRPQAEQAGPWIEWKSWMDIENWTANELGVDREWAKGVFREAGVTKIVRANMADYYMLLKTAFDEAMEPAEEEIDPEMVEAVQIAEEEEEPPDEEEPLDNEGD